MKILITGGAGFIGSHLAERHLALGDEVYIIDDLSTGSVANIQHLKLHPQFTYHIDTVCNTHLMAELVDLCDLIYHMAAAVGVRLILDSPVRTIETNIRCTEIVLSLAAIKRKRVLIASSSEVYGKKDQVPFREDDDLVLGATRKARWSYACSKAIDEFLAIAYWKEQKVPTVIARLFNTVGPRQTGRYGMVIPNFVTQALTGADIRVFGDGTQSRCFTHVSDAVDALVDIAAHPDANGEVYNVGGNHEITILDLAKKIKKMTGSDSRIVLVPYSTAYEEGFEDMQRRVPDITKLHELTGYTPKVSLEESLASIIEDQRMRLRERGVLAKV
ncbi:MAG TPA: GDP-mannose 4,6-dehydratase [Terriglobales bacterium]|nr:GDP-mannose 4,6-dehydratase [Terriglobales bacterium]